jgi:methylthioxylose transferase
MPAVALVAAGALMLAAHAIPAWTGWNVHINSWPPLQAAWQPRLAGSTAAVVLIAVLAVVYAVPLSERLTWRQLLWATFAVGLAWSLALALVDGRPGVGDVLDGPYEYLHTARATDDVPAMMREYVDRIPFSSDRHWPPHLAGHPPGAVLVFIGLDRVGLGAGLAAGLVVTVVAATTAVAVMATLRTLGDETHARRAAPFVALGPAAIWQSVSADAMFAAVAAWGLAALALASTRRSLGWATVAGLLLGYTVMMSYGLLLLGPLALAVLWLGGSWRPLLPAAAVALAVVMVFALLGFNYLDGLTTLHDRYWDGVAHYRPASYWLWGDLAALLYAGGPMLAVGLTQLHACARTVTVLATAALVSLLLADLSLMSKGEVERIWLPFVPWLLLPVSLLSERWRRNGLVVQLVTAVLIQHLLRTSW